jgi:hypothetical protein
MLDTANVSDEMTDFILHDRESTPRRFQGPVHNLAVVLQALGSPAAGFDFHGPIRLAQQGTRRPLSFLQSGLYHIKRTVSGDVVRRLSGVRVFAHLKVFLRD